MKEKHIIFLIRLFRKTKITHWIAKKLTLIIYFYLGLKTLIKAIEYRYHPTIPDDIPDKIENFEDLSWLFFSSALNQRVIKQEFNESAYIFSLIQKNKPKHLLEVGTCVGGGTILISTAKSKEAKFISIDIEDICIPKIKELLDDNTSLVIRDSKTYTPPHKLDFIFIDGNHGFDDVKADFENFFPHLEDGADILFHDAIKSAKHKFVAPTVNSFIKTIEDNTNLEFIKNAGSIKHFKKI